MGVAVQIESSVESFVGRPRAQDADRRQVGRGRVGQDASRRRNPATGEVLARVAEGDAEDIDRAVRAARRAFDDGPWPRMAPTRARAAAPEARRPDRAARRGARRSSRRSTTASRSSRAGTSTSRPRSSTSATTPAGRQDRRRDDPVRPERSSTTRGASRSASCGQIIPWNFPLLMAAWKLGPALACGNTVVLKPAEQTPLTALRLGELLARGGRPRRRGQHRHRASATTAGGALVRHPDGRQDRLHRLDRGRQGDPCATAAATLKRVSLELGGKSPNIVFADADLDGGRARARSSASSSTRASAAARARGSSSSRRCTTSSSTRSPKARAEHEAGRAASTPTTQIGPAGQQGAVRPRHRLPRDRARRKAPRPCSAASATGEGAREGLLREADRLHRREATT